MAILDSPVDTKSLEFRANAAQMRALVEELKRRRAEAALGGPARARERHVARGKPRAASGEDHVHFSKGFLEIVFHESPHPLGFFIIGVIVT